MIRRSAALWALGIIFLANFLNYLDRQLVSGLESSLEKALGLDAFQFGLLWTLFTVGYMLCAVPTGLLADRYSRTRLFALCVVVWSVATIASGMAHTKPTLFVSRVLIGVGEAGCLIIGPSLISDLFRKEVRGRALSVFYLGMPLGGATAFVLSALLPLVDWREMYEWLGLPTPLIDEYLAAPWRNMFYLAGLPGFVVAALIWLMRDPPRGVSEGAHHGMHRGGFGEYVKLLRTPTLMLIILGQAFSVITLIPLIHFGVKFFEEQRGLDPRQARLLALLFLVAGVCGMVLSGLIGDRLARRTRGAYAYLAGLCFLAGWPCLLAGFLLPERTFFIPALTAGCFFIFMCMPAVNTQIANVVSPAQRGTAWALAVFILHLLGDMLAPPVFGIVQNRIGRQQAYIYFSLALLLAGVACLLAGLTARRDAERVRRMVEDEAGAEMSALAK